MEVLEHTHKVISQIAKDYPGEIPVTVSGAMDTMTTFDFFNKNKEDLNG